QGDREWDFDPLPRPAAGQGVFGVALVEGLAGAVDAVDRDGAVDRGGGCAQPDREGVGLAHPGRERDVLADGAPFGGVVHLQEGAALLRTRFPGVVAFGQGSTVRIGGPVVGGPATGGRRGAEGEGGVFEAGVEELGPVSVDVRVFGLLVDLDPDLRRFGQGDREWDFDPLPRPAAGQGVFGVALVEGLAGAVDAVDRDGAVDRGGGCAQPDREGVGLAHPGRERDVLADGAPFGGVVYLQEGAALLGTRFARVVAF